VKRSISRTIIIAIVVGALVMALHISGALLRIEMSTSALLGGNTRVATRAVSAKTQYALVFVVAFLVAWAFGATSQRRKVAWLLPLLLVELLALGWICALFHTFFQPLPAVLSAALALGAVAGIDAFLHWRATRPVYEPPIEEEMAPQPPKERPQEVPIERSRPAPQIQRVNAVDRAPVTEAKACEVTVVVCDIGNKYDLAEELDPAQFGQLTADFIARASSAFADAGAFIESAAGEGVVALFGFPAENETHAETATRTAMRLVNSLKADGANGDSPDELQLHAGVSSGRIIVTPIRVSQGPSTLVVGEPIELARRFCIANRFYGSRVLIGPDTFELAGQILIARPIDFLSGVDVRERHEIYEPVSLAENATDDAIRRRDSFWHGVVLYREKRWAEAYAHFQPGE
jgi:class 3 adenylate cyclase